MLRADPFYNSPVNLRNKVASTKGSYCLGFNALQGICCLRMARA